MSVPASGTVTRDFRVKSEGVLTDADSLPSAVLYRNGAATAVSVTVASITGTGRYSASWTNPGYDPQDYLAIEVTAVVDAVSYTAKVWDGFVDIPTPQIAGLSYLQPDTTFITTVDFGAPVTSPAATLKIGDAAAASLATPVQVGSTGQYEVTVVVPSGATVGESGTVRVSGLIGGVERVILLIGLVAETITDINPQLPSGPGGIEKKLTIQVGGVAVDGAAVWVSTDIEGSNVIAGTLYTDVNGEVTFMLEEGTYYAWVQRGQDNFNNPTEFGVA